MGAEQSKKVIRREDKMISVIITCAGNHTRFGKNKLLLDLEGKPVFIRTIECFKKSKKVDEIIVAVRKNDQKVYQKHLRRFNLRVRLVEGGAKRYISAYNGLKISQGDYILVHDGARPLVTSQLIDQLADEVVKNEAVMLALGASTCIKYVEKDYVKKCLDRENTWLGQTPQAFKRRIILNAYKKAIDNEKFRGMDDCELVNKLGTEVKVIPGNKTNIKITNPSDLIIARHFFKMLKRGQDV